jgi:hypothetical protein
MNGDRRDNRIANLRDVSRNTNAENRHLPRRGHAVGLLGVVWRPRNKKFEARIHVDGKYMYLGIYHTKEEAHAVYLQAKRKHHAGFFGEFT